MVIGHSVEGRPITAVQAGQAGAPLRALVVAGTHGDEPGTLRITRALRRAGVRGAELWVVDRLNPDGLRRGTRQNARGVDLNRNFAVGWRPTGPRGSRFFAGPRPFSEPETRAIRRLVLRLRPSVVLWLHQPYGWVYVPPGAPRTARRLAAGIGLRTHPDDRLPGTAMHWAARVLPAGVSITVEYGARAPSARMVARSVRAITRLAAAGPEDPGDHVALNPAGTLGRLPAPRPPAARG